MDQESHGAALTKAGGSRGADRDKMLDPLQRPGRQELAGCEAGAPAGLWESHCGGHSPHRRCL